ncbi:unnamed protein product [Prunus armeniaca]|uniref:Uncharacterized protein n=1 Tax=Prunus armeniaca TaxID=36596 RepID=A0A6J5X4M4_PRUAR|nr:unnamed protein product [Prunus armeniaca]
MENEYKIFDVERDIKNNNSKSDLHFIWERKAEHVGTYSIVSFPQHKFNHPQVAMLKERMAGTPNVVAGTLP